MKIQNIIFLATFLLSTTISFSQFSDKKIITGHTYGISATHHCDIDGDGDLDLISASDKIAWYENIDGNGTYGKQRVIPNTFNTLGLVKGSDLDGDGDIDIVTGKASEMIVWYENIDGKGTFGPVQIISPPNSVDCLNCIEVIDIDCDGDNDIFSASSNDLKIAWYENDGNGSFGPQQVIFNAHYYTQIVFCDFDGDNDKDILYSGYYVTAWHENTNGLGAFGPQNVINSNLNVMCVDCSDLDLDGDNDVLVAARDQNKVLWYENDGNGIFGTEHIISDSVFQAKSVKSSDFDNDGDCDVLVASYHDNRIMWYENNGNGSFGPEQNISTNVQYIQAVYSYDINNDGNNDIISLSLGEHKIAWYKNDGSGSFSNQQLITASFNNAISATPCDVDADGKIDIIAASEGNKKIVWFKNLDGLGDFGVQRIICDTADVVNIFCCDIDGDGDIDVISSEYSKLVWYKNDGLGNFGIQQMICDSVGGVGIYASDIDGDNDKDVLFTYFPSTIAWIENIDGHGTFGQLNIINTSDHFWSVNTCDIDGDGDMDLIGSGGSYSRWYKNMDGNGTFFTQSAFYGDNYALGVDIDFDGDNDVLSSGPTYVMLSENINGTGIFNGTQIASGFYSMHEFNTCDIDGDGDLDLQTATGEDISWFENLTGFGNFGNKQTISNSSGNYRTIQLCDIDGDGDPDIISCYEDEIIWYENYFNSKYQIKGLCFYDKNQNAQKDSLELGFGFIQTELDPNELASFSNPFGEFRFATDTGDYTLTCNHINYWSLSTDSSEYHITLSDSIPKVDSLYFGFYPDTIFTSLSLSLTSGQPRCDRYGNLWINYMNIGTTIQTGVIELILDDSITFISSAVPPDSINGQKIFWSYDSLNFYTEQIIPLIVHYPDFNSMGDTISSIINIYSTDITGLHLFTDTVFDNLACSYDPNDKLVSPKGTGLKGIISKDEILEYTVRFQNIGNAEAINIRIRDQIDSNLDISNIQLLGSSHHPVDVYIEQNRWLVFQFDSIMLPDSTIDFLGSQGFVKFKITIDPNVSPNTQIINKACIYFDNNPAVISNTVLNTIECFISPSTPTIYNFYPDLVVNTYEDVQWYLNDTLIPGATDTMFTPLQNGEYTVIITDTNGCTSISDTYIHNTVQIIEIKHGLISNVYPNPFEEYSKVEFSETLDGNYNFIIYNILGNEVRIYQDLKSNTLLIHKAELSKGIYLCKLLNNINETEEGTVKLVIE